MSRHLPEWLKVKAPKRGAYEEIASYLKAMNLHTVCQSASCPNIGECFARGTATFMILGDICTRSCGFCGVKSGTPDSPESDEPEQVAKAVVKMGLSYVVITSVTRDDLPDGGAGHFAKTIICIKAAVQGAKIEVLIPDFGGSSEALDTVLDAEPFMLNHNVETVPRLYPSVRPDAEYVRSLRLLETAKRHRSSIHTKSGLMLGLGETEDEVIEVLHDLREADCEIITIGQYLRPSATNLPVAEYIHPKRFENYHRLGKEMGFRYVASGPFVRSSYHAEEAVE